MNTLLKIRQKLNAQRLELGERLQRITRDRSRETQPLSADFADQATQRENDEVLDRLDESTRADLLQLEHAIAHLDRGLYGFCEHCGERIEPARLLAMPQATVCFGCADGKRAVPAQRATG